MHKLAKYLRRRVLIVNVCLQHLGLPLVYIRKQEKLTQWEHKSIPIHTHILVTHYTYLYSTQLWDTYSCIFVFIYKAKYSYLNRQQFESQRITNGAKSTLSAVPPTAKRDQRESHTQRETERERKKERDDGNSRKIKRCSFWYPRN